MLKARNLSKEYLIKKGFCKVNDLQNESLKYKSEQKKEYANIQI